MDERGRALEQIAAIARQHGITAAEVTAVLEPMAEAAADGRARGVLVRVLAYLGGTFVFAGIGIFIALQWDDLNSAARVLVTLGSGVALFVLAVLASREPRFDKASTPLFLAAAALEPAGMLVAFAEYGSGGDWRIAGLITSATMAIQFAAAFAALRRSVALFMVILFGTLCWWTGLDLLEVDGTVIEIALGAAMLLAAVGVDRMGRGGIVPFWYFAGGAAFLHGFFDAVERTPLEILFLAAAAGFVYASVVLHSRTLLAVATLGVLGYTAWFTGQYFADSVGWPLALMAFGLALIGLSALAYRIDRQYVRRR